MYTEKYRPVSHILFTEGSGVKYDLGCQNIHTPQHQLGRHVVRCKLETENQEVRSTFSLPLPGVRRFLFTTVLHRDVKSMQNGDQTAMKDSFEKT